MFFVSTYYPFFWQNNEIIYNRYVLFLSFFVMRRFLRVVLWLFLLLFTLFVLAYTAILTLFNQQTIRALHESIPPLASIGSFLGVFDSSYQYDELYQAKQQAGETLKKFALWKKEQNEQSTTGHQLYLDDPREHIRLYAPVRHFKGQVSADIDQLTLFYVNKGRDISKQQLIDLQAYDEHTFDRDIEVSLGKETLFNGKNTYIIEASFADGTVMTKKIHLQIDYERIEVADAVLYLDTDYIPDDETEDILRETIDFDGETTNFVSYACDPWKEAPDILLKKNHQYQTVSACLSFSLSKDYLLLFSFQHLQWKDYLFDIIDPDQGVIYNDYALLEKWLNTQYYNLVFFDPWEQLLKFLAAKWDDLSYAVEITYYDVKNKRGILTVAHTNGNQLLVENTKERMLVYLYKERGNYHSLLQPVLRYQFWYSGAKINEWPIYTLPIQLLWPAKEYGSTFSFKIILDGYMLHVDDGIKTLTFDIRLIGKTIEITDSIVPINQPHACDQVYMNIYSNQAGKSIENGVASWWKTYRLVGEWLHASQIKLFHNNKKEAYDLEQYYQGWFYTRLYSQRWNLQKGDNIYTIVAYDERGKELCRIQTELEIRS